MQALKDMKNKATSAVAGRAWSDYLDYATYCQGLGVPLYLLAFFTPNWRVFPQENANAGLFQECNKDGCEGSFALGSLWRDMFSYSTLSFLCYVLSCGLMPAYLTNEHCRNRFWLKGGLVLILGGFAFSTLTWWVWEAFKQRNKDEATWKSSEMGWSFYVFVGGSVMFLGAGICVALDLNENKS